MLTSGRRMGKDVEIWIGWGEITLNMSRGGLEEMCAMRLRDSVTFVAMDWGIMKTESLERQIRNEEGGYD